MLLQKHKKGELIEKKPVSFLLCWSGGHWTAFSEHDEMSVSSNFKARLDIIFLLAVSIQAILVCLLCRDFSSYAFFVCTSLLFHLFSTDFTTSSLWFQDPTAKRMRYPPADKYFGFPDGPPRKAKRAAFCFYFLLSGRGAAGLAVLVLFHQGQV